MVVLNNSCLLCKYYIYGKSCVAFPDGIPDEIWNGKINHNNSYPSDGGIQFEPREAKEEEKSND